MDGGSTLRGRGREAKHPGEIPSRGWMDVLWRTWEEVGEANLFLIAGGVTYALILALFPGLAALVSLYGLAVGFAGRDHRNRPVDHRHRLGSPCTLPTSIATTKPTVRWAAWSCCSYGYTSRRSLSYSARLSIRNLRSRPARIPLKGRRAPWESAEREPPTRWVKAGTRDDKWRAGDRSQECRIRDEERIYNNAPSNSAALTGCAATAGVDVAAAA